MNRKDFLATTVPLAAVMTAFTRPGENKPKHDNKNIPPYLKKGDVIGISCPSGYISAEECEAAIRKMKEWGYEVRTGKTVGAKDFTFAGTDEERAQDLQQMLDDPSVHTIMLGRGGYGAVRMIDKIDFSRFTKNPKWIIGFSDATAFHTHINTNFGIATIHSKMCNSFPDDFSKADQSQIDSIESIRQCLAGEKMVYKRLPVAENRAGEGTGMLVGGNLSLIQMMTDSISDLDTDGRILFIEDVGEYAYKIDGMLWNLKRGKKLEKLKGLIVGAFRLKPDDPGEEFGRTIYDLVMEKVQEYHYPVCFDFPVGHVKENYALKYGVRHRLTVNDTGTLLEEW